MQRFFDSFESIQQFTLSLDFHQDQLECQFCLKPDQFVSHGIVYKQHGIDTKESVGKRILCSNRYGRSGCGRTFQLYVASIIPSLHYGVDQLVVFIFGIFSGLSVEQAYSSATESADIRNAWRWLKRLRLKISEFRCFLSLKSTTHSQQFLSRSHSLQVLLPSLSDLFSQTPDCPCTHYQQQHQSAFF